jgi:hypothetical protein
MGGDEVSCRLGLIVAVEGRPDSPHFLLHEGVQILLSANSARAGVAYPCWKEAGGQAETEDGLVVGIAEEWGSGEMSRE